MDITLTISNVDFSPKLSTYHVTHEVTAQQMVTTMDGTEHSASWRRPVVEFSMWPLTDAQCNQYYAALSRMEVTVAYTDPYLNANRTVVMRVASSLDAVFGLRSCDGNRYYKGGTIKLRSKTIL